jgi:translation initiation factor 3 subunit A
MVLRIFPFHQSPLPSPSPLHRSHRRPAVNLRATETVQGFLETRFEQLRVACALELWQEAYRSIEDIHGLVQLSKKTPKAALMATYFEKLAQIFWVSGNHLFHAYALFRFYTFSLLSANSAAASAAAAASAGGPGAAAAPSVASSSAAANEAAERTRLASRLLLSALVIPQRSAAPGDEVRVHLGLGVSIVSGSCLVFASVTMMSLF